MIILGTAYAATLTARKFRRILADQISCTREIYRSLPDKSDATAARRTSLAIRSAWSILPAYFAYEAVIRASMTAGERYGNLLDLIHSLI